MKRIYILILFTFLSFNVSGFQIFVETPNNGTIALEVEANDTIENVKFKIEDQTGIIFATQILHFNGQLLEDVMTLADYSIGKESLLQLTISSLGVSDIELNNQIRLFPNPANDFIYISGLQKQMNYKIYNVLGKEIRKGVIVDDEKIYIKNITSGVYILKFNDGNTIPFIKE